MSIREFSRGGISGAIMGLTVVRPVDERVGSAFGSKPRTIENCDRLASTLMPDLSKLDSAREKLPGLCRVPKL